MATGWILYNPLAGGGRGEDEAKVLETILPRPYTYYDMTAITNYAAFLSQMEAEDYLILAGGDGTLNRFANDTADLKIDRKIFYYPIGTGNDFARDMGKAPYDPPFPVQQQLTDLPQVRVGEKTYRFLNGVGFGIDGYCCQIGDQKREKGEKVNYAAIAVKGLLGGFAPRKAQVEVDGKSYTFSNVWIAPTMCGRYYGGGMMAAPEQERGSDTLSLVLFHTAGRLRTLLAFPGIFKGEHIKHKRQVTVLTGREISVEFDRPTPLQIDGETIRDVTSYRASAPCHAICFDR